MLRIVKRYNLAYKTSAKDGSPTVPAAEISFSSYPGMLHSMDDWYVLSSGLLVTETTIENYNNDLWAKVKPTNSVSLRKKSPEMCPKLHMNLFSS